MTRVLGEFVVAAGTAFVLFEASRHCFAINSHRWRVSGIRLGFSRIVAPQEQTGTIVKPWRGGTANKLNNGRLARCISRRRMVAEDRYAWRPLPDRELLDPVTSSCFPRASVQLPFVPCGVFFFFQPRDYRYPVISDYVVVLLP